MGPVVLAVLVPEAQVVGHDVADQPLVEEAPQFLNAIVVPRVAGAEEGGDCGAEFLVQFEVGRKVRVTTVFHQLLFVGKVGHDILKQFIERGIHRAHVKLLDQRKQMLVLAVDLRHPQQEPVAGAVRVGATQYRGAVSPRRGLCRRVCC